MSEKRFFSPSTGGFYSEAVHGPRQIEEPREPGKGRRGKPKLLDNPYCTIPADGVEISDGEHEALFAAQAEGKAIAVVDGRPVLADRVQDPAELEAANRNRRNKLLAGSDWTQIPDTPLSKRERTAWAAYRQQLRDVALDRELAAVDWPAPPQGD